MTFAYGNLQWVTGDVSGGVYPQIGFDAGDGVHYYNAPGTLTRQVLDLAYTCLNYTVGQNPQAGLVLPVTPNLAFGPNPVGVGQEVTASGGGLAGATRVVTNGADATASTSGSTATALTFRVPSTATLAGVTNVVTPVGALTSGGALTSNSLNVLPEPGQALALDGTDDNVSVPHAAALNLSTALTVEAWVRTSSSAERYILTKGQAAWQLAVNPLGLAAGRAGFALNTGLAPVWVTGTSTISDGHWHHVAGTYDGSTAKLYVDGTLESSLPMTGTIVPDTAPLLLGCNEAGAKNWLGGLDEVRIWRTARSAAELATGLHQMPALPSPDLAACFNFDRGTPGGENQDYNTFHDVVGGLPATLNNVALTGTASNFVESYALVLPAALAATAVTPTSFRLQWQPSARGSVSSYVVEVSTSPAFTTPTTFTITPPTALTQAVASLTANTTYYYRVRAERIYGVSGQGAYARGSLTTPGSVASCGATLSSFTPTSGDMGSTLVTLTGAGFSAVTVTGVTFGGVAASSFTVVNATTMRATVPAGAVTGSIGLVTTCGRTSSAAAFTVNAPTLTVVSPSAELPGQTVTLTGTGLLPSSTVSFGSQPAVAVTYVSPTQLQAVVPVPNIGYAGINNVTLGSLNGNAPTPAAFTTLAVASDATVNTCTAAPAVTVTADNSWHYVLSTEGQVVLAFNSQGRNLGNVGASYLLADPAQTVRRDAHGQYYPGRNWRLTTSAGAFTGSSVLVRYYGLNEEYAQLQAADPGHIASLASLRLTQYSGSNEDCVLTNNNNTTGTSVLLTPATTYGPDGSGFFVAEAVVPNHFSEFYLGGNSSPLPVELTRFTATLVDNAAVRLAWATASEKNSDQFEVERSLDGRAFGLVGTVPAGTSTTTRAYQLLDAKLPAGAITLYYRLRQVDLDGTSAYSPVRSVVLNGKAGLALFPNPTTRAATLTGAPAGILVRVFDALGRQVLTATADAAGTAALTLPDGLATGLYVVKAGATALRLAVE